MMQERNVFICSNPNSIASDKTDMIKWSMEAKKESDNPFVFSLFFPVFPCCSLVLWSMANTSYFCRQKRAVRRKTIRNYKQNNKKYGIFYHYGFKLGKTKERDTQSWRDLPQGIRGTEQAYRLAAQWWCVQVAQHQQAHIAALPGYRCTTILPNRA